MFTVIVGSRVPSTFLGFYGIVECGLILSAMLTLQCLLLVWRTSEPESARGYWGNASWASVLARHRWPMGWVHECQRQPRVRAEVHTMGGSVMAGCKMAKSEEKWTAWKVGCSHSTPKKWNNASISMHYDVSGYWLPPNPTNENRPQLGLETSQNLLHNRTECTRAQLDMILCWRLSPSCS
jgi:hypothetical protein